MNDVNFMFVEIKNVVTRPDPVLKRITNPVFCPSIVLFHIFTKKKTFILSVSSTSFGPVPIVAIPSHKPCHLLSIYLLLLKVKKNENKIQCKSRIRRENSFHIRFLPIFIYF